jgi:hypothetical protein
MSNVGTVTTKLGRAINVVLATSSSTWKRPTAVIDQRFKDDAVVKIQTAIDSAKLFKNADMSKITQISIEYADAFILNVL